MVFNHYFIDSLIFSDTFANDYRTKQTHLVSISSSGHQGNNRSDSPSISANGRYVVFESAATNLVAPYLSNVFYPINSIYVHDLITKQTRLVSMGIDDFIANESCYQSNISDDGRYIAFGSYATNLVNNDTAGWNTFIAPNPLYDPDGS